MDINAVVYGGANIPIPPRPDIYIDEDAEVKKMAWPLNKLRFLPAGEERRDDHDEESQVSSAAERSKHESFDFAGSVFLITDEGKTLHLPMPSKSKHDPLNWGKWKSVGAMVSLWWYSIANLTAVQAASLMMGGVTRDFSEQVSDGPMLNPFLPFIADMSGRTPFHGPPKLLSPHLPCSWG